MTDTIATGDSTLIFDQERSEVEVDLAALVESYGTLLFRVAHTVLRSRSEAEDVVQDTFVRVLENRAKLPQVREMRVWLVRIAWNLALDRRRRIRPEQIDAAFAESLASAQVPADQALGEARALAVLMQAIERLPKLERQALLLSGVDALSTAEVAKILGKSASGVRALLFRARTRLKERTRGGRG